MKLFYFVRHGVTLENEQGIYHDAESPLTEKGLEQARQLALRFKDISIDSVISSTMERARQTAAIIGQAKKVPVAYSNLLVERTRPAEIRGKYSKDPEAQKIHVQLDKHYHDSAWHYSDEENFEDLKQRAIKALDFMVNLPAKNIVVVTHGTFLRALLMCMLIGETLNSHQFVRAEHFLKTVNTGITMCQCANMKNEEEHQNRVTGEVEPWRLITWNDHSHLG